MVSTPHCVRRSDEQEENIKHTYYIYLRTKLPKVLVGGQIVTAGFVRTANVNSVVLTEDLVRRVVVKARSASVHYYVHGPGMQS